MSSYRPPYARMRQIKRDTVRPDSQEAPINVEAALAAVAPAVVADVVPEAVIVVEEPAFPASAEPEPEIVKSEPEIVDSAVTEPEPDPQAPDPEPEPPAPEPAPKPAPKGKKAVVFNDQMSRKELVALAVAAGFVVPASWNKAAIVAELTKLYR